MLWFSALTFTADDETRPMIDVLFAIASIPEVASVARPNKISEYDLFAGYSLITDLIIRNIKDGGYGFANSPEAKFPSLPNKEKDDADTRRYDKYERQFNSKIAAFVSYLRLQWSCEEPTEPKKSDCAGLKIYMDVGKIITVVRSRWKIWYQNHLFYIYLMELVRAISRQPFEPSAGQLPLLPELAADRRVASDKGFAAIANLFSNNKPPVIRSENRPLLRLNFGQVCSGGNAQLSLFCVQLFLRGLKVGTWTNFERRYCKDFNGSFRALFNINRCETNSTENRLATVQNEELLEEYWKEYQTHFLAQFRSLATFESLEVQNGVLVNNPRICRTFFLFQLSNSNWKKLPVEWKPALIEFALVFYNFQRTRRLLRTYSSGNSLDLLKELQNAVYSNWNSVEYPQALFMEVENNITIRLIQFEIARTMTSPPDNRNAIMQLNMGEGKNSVIVPLMAFLLANNN